jgi:hypothetical protein
MPPDAVLTQRHMRVAIDMSVRELLKEHGQTYAAEAGITLKNTPSPLYQLLVLTTLMSVRIRADIAVTAARELFKAGWRSPSKMLESTWQQRVDALGRGSYVRYDESTATYLADSAQLLLDEYQGDLRKLRSEADGDVKALHRGLTAFPRIGPVGARIFTREVQAVWPEYQPYFDDRTIKAARKAGLPGDPGKLADLVKDKDIAPLAAALTRLSLS